MIVAIDGPAGAGKSTVARLLAERLGFRYLDTGAMYRALAWLALERALPLGDGATLAAAAEERPVELGTDGTVSIDGTDVTDEIRSERVDAAVPEVARHAAVREVMRRRQRELADLGNAVIEGRDIGRVVVPDAEVKVYLVADPGVRARRRLAERPGAEAAALARELERRDRSDSAQLEPAPDALPLDTTALSVDVVVERIEALVHARAAGAA